MSPEGKTHLLVLLLSLLTIAANFCVYKCGWHRGKAAALKKASEDLKGLAALVKAGGFPFFRIPPDGKSITCLVCGATSHNENDVREKYCARCHVFHEERYLRT